jgi:hypothetical protein
MKATKYQCSYCGSDKFKLVEMSVKGTWGRTIEDVLVCANQSCQKKFYISPCNSNGLIQVKKE